MTEKARRKELQTQYRENRPPVGVYRIVNRQTQKALLGSSLNLPNVRSKLEFARSTGSTGVFDYRLKKDVQAYGIEAFELEILEELETTPEMTQAQIQADLAALESLWREKQDPALLY
jgi:hypothetical protein